ncbi:MAG: AMP-binding protein, partial [Solirubrobacteraceae bacterium]
MTGVGERNLARLTETAFERRGDHPALLFEGTTHSSAELFARACRTAGGLAELGVTPGDRVTVSMANCPEVGILYSAIWRAGAVVTPGMFLLPEEDLRHQIADSQATVVCTTPEFEDKVRSAAAGLAHVRAVVTTGPGGDGLLSLAELETAAAVPIVARGDDDLAALLYTGGTTGRAKGVMLSHANLHYTGTAAHQSAYVPGITRGLGTLPLSHAYGI